MTKTIIWAGFGFDLPSFNRKIIAIVKIENCNTEKFNIGYFVKISDFQLSQNKGRFRPLA